MRGKFIGLLMTCMALQVLAEPVPVSIMTPSSPLGIAQEGTVYPGSLTKRPRFVICGGDMACTEPTIKTLDNRHEQPVLVAQVAPVPPAPVMSSDDNAERAAKDALDADAKKVDVTVRFATGSAALDKRAKTVLAKLVMEQHLEGQTIRVSGYTDSVGGEKINDRLARKRARAVKTYLVGAGVDPTLIQIGSVSGKCCYVEPNTTKAGRAANRRAEVKSSSISVSIKE